MHAFSSIPEISGAVQTDPYEAIRMVNGISGGFLMLLEAGTGAQFQAPEVVMTIPERALEK